MHSITFFVSNLYKVVGVPRILQWMGSHVDPDVFQKVA